MNQNARFEGFPVEEREELTRLAGIADSFQPDERFLKKTEMQLKDAFAAKKEKTMTRFNLFWQVLLGTAALTALTLGTIWMVRGVAPELRNPASGEAPVASLSVSTPAPDTALAPKLTPDLPSYDWHGTTVYRAVDFPKAPSKVELYAYSPSEQLATDESVRALALRLGIDGQVESGGSHAYSYRYLVSAGQKRLFVNSDQDFLYVFSDTKTLTAMPLDKAQQIIEPYLKAHGFDFKHKIQAGSVPGWFLVVPITVDGLPTYLGPSQIQGLSMAISQDGQIFQMQANLLAAGGDSLGKFAIFSAKEAWQKFIDPNALPENFILPGEPPSTSAMPALTIENIDLVYYIADLHTSASTGTFIQPVWRFYGHYSDGQKFECLIRALIPE